jgi:ribosomal protein S18 acetylase RimI-like enzyme
VTTPRTSPNPPTGRPTVSVREARDDELDAAGAVARAAYASEGFGPDSYLALVGDARGRAREAVVAVAVDDADRVVGSVTFAEFGTPYAQVAAAGEAEFRMLGVSPDHRGAGVGAALVDWCVARARALGLSGLALCSQETMTAAHRLYLRHGFVRRPALDWSPLEGHLLLGFHLDLTG